MPSQNQRVIPLVKRIKSTQTFQAIGYIQFNLDKQALTEIFESRMNRIDGNLFVTDADGNVIAGVQSLRNPVDLSRAGDLPESENYRIQQIDGREYMVVSYLSDDGLAALGVDPHVRTQRRTVADAGRQRDHRPFGLSGAGRFLRRQDISFGISSPSLGSPKP